jgi:glycosyltransferase involved in cell wall biosynthesis
VLTAKNQTFLPETPPFSHPRYQVLSVLIPAYNAASTLGQQLEALKAQTYQGDWEILVVDNGSTDQTAEIVRTYQAFLPHLRLIHAPDKQSTSYARNVGAKAARGGAFLFCDADDMANPEWVANLAKALETYDWVTGAIEVQTLNPNPPPQQYSRKGAQDLYLNYLPFAVSCNFAISRQLFEAVGGFSEEFPRSQDVDFSWRLQLQGYKLHHAPEAVMHYRYRDKLRLIWKQAVSIGIAEVKLFRHYTMHGMPSSSMQEVWQRYKWLLKKAPLVWRLNSHKRERWVRLAARSWGRLIGSLRYRTLYLSLVYLFWRAM